MPDARPRERFGQLSIAIVVPLVHSAPMPTPKSVRRVSTTVNVGASVTAPSHSANHTTLISRGSLRPHLSAARPASHPP